MQEHLPLPKCLLLRQQIVGCLLNPRTAFLVACRFPLLVLVSKPALSSAVPFTSLFVDGASLPFCIHELAGNGLEHLKIVHPSLASTRLHLCLLPYWLISFTAAWTTLLPSFWVRVRGLICPPCPTGDVFVQDFATSAAVF